MLRGIITNKEKCQRCGNSTIISDTETGETICKKCGFVISERLETTEPEWRSFVGDGKPNKARTGDGTSLRRHDMGLSTIINPANKDAAGKPLTYNMKSTLKRLRISNNRIQFNQSTDRNFREAFSDLDRMKDKLGISNAIVEKSAYIYRKAIENGLVRGRSIAALMGATLYAACRDSETPRTLRDIAENTNIKRKEIARCYRLLVKELNLKMPVVDSVQCISRIASKLEISEKTKRYAIEILRKAKQNDYVAGKNPMSLAGTALYLSCVKMKEDRSQKEIAQAANITEVTIRNRSKGIKDFLKV